MSLCRKKHYKHTGNTLPEHAHKNQTKRSRCHQISQALMMAADPRKGTRACTCHKASYTLEAAVILPLLAGFFAFLLFFFRVLQVQTGVQTALYCAGRKTACEAGTVDSETALLVLAEAHFRKEIKNYEVIDDFVTGGTNGISLLMSDFTGDYIELKANYYIKSKINLIKTAGIHATQTAKNRKWTGSGGGGKQEDYVYVTQRGSVYHRSRFCHYLDLSISVVSADIVLDLRNKDGDIYYSCPTCAKNGLISEFVYITDYGERYHNRLSCSGLKRTIYLIPMSEVRGRGACSKCGGQENEERKN